MTLDLAAIRKWNSLGALSRLEYSTHPFERAIDCEAAVKADQCANRYCKRQTLGFTQHCADHAPTLTAARQAAYRERKQR
jgi:hypothetical protein